jgi:predicted acylesterase/phospholipase RssA
MYQVGVVAALEDGVEGFRTADVAAFVGSAGGATVAAFLAAGIPAQRLYRALLDPVDPFFPLQRQHLLRLDGAEWRRVASSTLAAARRLLSSVTSRPLDADVWNELDRFWDSLPAGIFALDALEQFLVETMQRRGVPNDFAQLPRPLVLVATDLDAGARALFGLGELAHVPVARAICASAATPLLFAPVRIDGRDYVEAGNRTAAHVDVAASLGCGLVLVVNPTVPIRTDPDAREVPTGHGAMRHVRDKGALWVASQSWRVRTESRMREGLARFRSEHPEVEVVLLEPEPGDATMFMHSPMNFAARRQILEDGYTATIRALRDPGSPLRRALEGRGFAVKSP